MAALSALIVSASSLGSAAAAGPTRVGDRFGDWTFECAALAEGQTLCSLNQTLVANDGKTPIARFSLGRNAKTGMATFGALLTLGLDIPAGVTVSFDQGTPIPLTLKTCVPNGCVVDATLTPKWLESLKSGKPFAVVYTLRSTEKPVTLNGSSKGLNEGLDGAGIK